MVRKAGNNFNLQGIRSKGLEPPGSEMFEMFKIYRAVGPDMRVPPDHEILQTFPIYSCSRGHHGPPQRCVKEQQTLCSKAQAVDCNSISVEFRTKGSSPSKPKGWNLFRNTTVSPWATDGRPRKERWLPGVGDGQNHFENKNKNPWRACRGQARRPFGRGRQGQNKKRQTIGPQQPTIM
jgi:hypothetical protein